MSFSIYIKNLQGKSVMINVKDNDKIMDGKRKYREKIGSQNPDPQWKYGSQVLKNEKTFGYYGIEEGDNITSNDRSEGGKKI